MNRKERRLRGVKQKVATYNLSKDQIEALKKDAVEKASEQAFILMLGIPLIVMRDEFGFGKRRLEHIAERMLSHYEAFEQGYVTLDDIKTTIEEETGIIIKK